MKNEKGMALLFVMMFLLTASFGLASLMRLGASQVRVVNNDVQSAASFYMMETSAEMAKIALRDTNFLTVGNPALGETNFGEGEISYTVADDPAGNPYKKLITGLAGVPNLDNPKQTRTVEVMVYKPPTLPVSFWDYALYSPGTIRANGNTYDVIGDCVSGTGFVRAHDRITGTETVNAGINPLARFDFNALKAIAQSQTVNGHDNYYTAAEIGVVPYPTTFYYAQPSVANPAGTPNVVFIEGNLTVNGKGSFAIGGFCLVVGDVLTNDDASADTTINGNGAIDGVVYTLGKMTTNGGAGGLNVLGGVFAEDGITFNGNTNVTYSQPYMDSIETLQPPAGMSQLSWNEVSSEL